MLFFSLYECPFTKLKLLSYTSDETKPLGFWQNVLTLSLYGYGYPINFPSYIYLFTSFITASGNSYLTPISTQPDFVIILCLSHISTSQFAPFLPTAIITLSENNSCFLLLFLFKIFTPFTELFSIIKSWTSVSNIIFILFSSK